MTIESTSIGLPSSSLQISLDGAQFLRCIHPDRFFRILAWKRDHGSPLCNPGNERQKIALAGAGASGDVARKLRKQTETSLRREREQSHVALASLGHGVALAPVQDPRDASGLVALEMDIRVRLSNGRHDERRGRRVVFMLRQ